VIQAETDKLQAQIRPAFLQKDRPSLVPQKAVNNVSDSQSPASNILLLFSKVKP
jgi:hypothetical protein